MNDNLTILGCIVAVNLDWVDPVSKGIIALVAVGTLVLRILEYRRNKPKK